MSRRSSGTCRPQRKIPTHPNHFTQPYRKDTEHGPIIRAVAEATSTSAELEGLWSEFLGGFDRAVETRVRAEQRAGRIGAMDARAMARALNRLDAAHLIDSFGRHPQPDPDQVAQTLTTIWISTLYGPEKLNNAPLSVMLNEMST